MWAEGGQTQSAAEPLSAAEPPSGPHTVQSIGTRKVYLKLIHHLADSTSFLPNDVAVKIKGHLHLDGDRN